MATNAVQAWQRLLMPGGQPPEQPKPGEPQGSAAPTSRTVLGGEAPKPAAQSTQRDAPAGADNQDVGPQNDAAPKAPARALRDAANSAAALGDPETGKEFVRKARAKGAKAGAASDAKVPAAKGSKPRAAEKTGPVAVEEPQPRGARRRKAEVPKPTAPARKPRQPKAAERPDSPDDLKAISGIGPKLEKVLNRLGIWTYAQLAGLAQEEIAWLEDHLGFGGRIGRDDWVGQAKALVPTRQ